MTYGHGERPVRAHWPSRQNCTIAPMWMRAGRAVLESLCRPIGNHVCFACQRLSGLIITAGRGVLMLPRYLNTSELTDRAHGPCVREGALTRNARCRFGERVCSKSLGTNATNGINSLIKSHTAGPHLLIILVYLLQVFWMVAPRCRASPTVTALEYLAHLCADLVPAAWGLPLTKCSRHSACHCARPTSSIVLVNGKASMQ